jgi:hypothetical protein
MDKVQKYNSFTTKQLRTRGDKKQETAFEETSERLGSEQVNSELTH